jgi:glucan phosphoethanolaminetransferase (alkaline phosphatase superfamily)
MMWPVNLIGKARGGYYVAVIVLAAAVWIVELQLQSGVQVYGVQIDHLSQLQEKQLDAFLNMNSLLTTLGTALLGALGFLMISGRKAHPSPKHLLAAFGSAICAMLSLFFGYQAYKDILFMFQNNTFDLDGTLIVWDRQAHFYTLLLGVLLFADFAFHTLSQEDGGVRPENPSRS